MLFMKLYKTFNSLLPVYLRVKCFRCNHQVVLHYAIQEVIFKEILTLHMQRNYQFCSIFERDVDDQKKTIFYFWKEALVNFRCRIWI